MCLLIYLPNTTSIFPFILIFHAGKSHKLRLCSWVAINIFVVQDQMPVKAFINTTHKY